MKAARGQRSAASSNFATKPLSTTSVSAFTIKTKSYPRSIATLMPALYPPVKNRFFGRRSTEISGNSSDAHEQSCSSEPLSTNIRLAGSASSDRRLSRQRRKGQHCLFVATTTAVRCVAELLEHDGSAGFVEVRFMLYGLGLSMYKRLQPPPSWR
jgi:hypothetical protein